MSDDVLKGFFKDVDEAEKVKLQKSLDSASSENGISFLKTSGNYLMEVDTKCFFKGKGNDKKLVIYPSLKVSEKGSLMVVISFKVVDGAPGVPKGSTIITNIVLLPAHGASGETIDNITKMMKPRITTLIGHDKIGMTQEWIEENLLPEFKEDGNGNMVLVRDHKMKQKVMVLVEDDVYNNEATVKVKSFRKADPDSKSVPNTFSEEPVEKQKMADPDADVDPVSKDTEEMKSKISETNLEDF